MNSEPKREVVNTTNVSEWSCRTYPDFDPDKKHPFYNKNSASDHFIGDCLKEAYVLMNSLFETKDEHIIASAINCNLRALHLMSMLHRQVDQDLIYNVINRRHIAPDDLPQNMLEEFIHFTHEMEELRENASM